MKTIYTKRHLTHAQGRVEFAAGELVEAFENPSRAEFILDRVREIGLGPVLAPRAHSLHTAEKIHDCDYLEFLQTAWSRWSALGRTGTVLPSAWPTRALPGDIRPDALDGQLGYYSFDASAGLVEGSWDAIKASHDVALTAADVVNRGERGAFALCRPPGHHAGTAFMGGFCFVNNAAVAAQFLRDAGAPRIAILDIDYHHGNGSQQIFYQRDDVLFLSLHADPRHEYPYFSGHEHERGAGAGEGYTQNYPMPFGTTWQVWSEAVSSACRRITEYQPDAVVVSLGVDTFERDPISRFRLKSEDYPKIGRRIAKLALPTLFVMEGGYAVDEIAINTTGVLTGFED